MFQFQYGAIWRTTTPPPTETQKAVSIPVWCDLEKYGKYILTSRSAVSIPVWCDLEVTKLQRGFDDTCVSIPVWCDLERVFVKVTNLNKVRFNSSMVRFGAKHRDQPIRFCSSFQFQYGAIWSERSICLRSPDRKVSIPVWCDLEHRANRRYYGNGLFQFQYGAIWRSVTP